MADNYCILQHEDFTKWRVPELKAYLQKRGITVSQKNKPELVELVTKAYELNLEVEEDGETSESLRSLKLTTEAGEKVPNPYSLSSDWTVDFSGCPNYTFGDMYSYLITKKGYDHEGLKAFKSFEGYRLYWDGHVTNLMLNMNAYHQHRLLKFSVKPTERERTALDNKPNYDGWIIMKEDGAIHAAHCPCAGGADGACRHIGAALLDLEATIRENFIVTCTGNKCAWKQRGRTHTAATKIKDMDFTRPTINKTKRQTIKPKSDIYNPSQGLMTDNLVNSFRKLVFKAEPSAVLLHLVPGDDTNSSSEEEEEMDPDIFHAELIDESMAVYPPSLQDIASKGRCIKRKFSYTEDEIKRVEKKTRLQSKATDWFKFKKGRISASKCKRVTSLKESTSPVNALKEVMGYSNIPQTPAMQQGLEKEPEIAQMLIRELQNEGHSRVNIDNCGFFVSKTHGHIGASPDGILYTSKEENPGVVEFKYVQVKEKETLRDVLLRQHICVNCPTGLKLNTNHKYYFQLYQQMFATRYSWGFLAICGSNNEFFKEKVIFNSDFWKPILNKLETFFDHVILPELSYPRVKYGLDHVLLV